MASMFRQSWRTFAAQAAAPQLPLHRLESAISPAVVADLQRHGFAVIDEVLGEPTASNLREELKAVRQHMHANCTHLVNDRGAQASRTRLVVKEGILEAELLEAKTQELAPLCAAIQRSCTLRTMLNVHLPELTLDSQAIKLQWNKGNSACFPMHFDTDVDVDGRALTAISYLNPGWQPGDGGELRLYPFPYSPSVDIAPLHDRMVLFPSQTMLHRVLPSLKQRYCLTVWLSAARRQQNSSSERVQVERAAARAILSGNAPLGGEAARLVLGLEEVRKHAVKWVYREEWAASLAESHPQGSNLVAEFEREMGVVGRALRPLLPALELWKDAGGEGWERGGGGPAPSWV